MCVVLQAGGNISANLLEAIVEITDDASCNATYSGRVTKSMICAVTPCGFKGPCHVR
jgi:hypothetical protein